MAIQLPEELFERLKAYLKKNNLKQKQFIIGLIEDALEQDEEDTTAQADSESASETEEPDEPDMDAESRRCHLRLPLLHLQARCGIVEIADGRCGA